MKYIWLGIKDYCRDCWHDWLLTRLVNTYDNEKIEEGWFWKVCRVFPWKEGSVWHYIRQRKIAKQKDVK
jgi:hypothetical protein